MVGDSWFGLFNPVYFYPDGTSSLLPADWMRLICPETNQSTGMGETVSKRVGDHVCA